MAEKIRIGIAGYGNLGKAVLTDLKNFPDLCAAAVVSRRPMEAGLPVYSYDNVQELSGKIDVMLMCGGSKEDLPAQSPKMAEMFNLVDSFDTHAQIPAHIKRVGAAAEKSGTLAAVSVGWDPGLFSLSRALFGSVLPGGADYTFWGRGVSQGHSDAIRRVKGVKKAVQYTIPKDDAVNKVRGGSFVKLTTREKHLRECFVVLCDGADAKAVETAIKTMPDYFADYDTFVHFIGEDEFNKNHTALPHGGFVVRGGETESGVKHLLEFSIRLDSNPQFTASVMLAYARAVYRLNKEGKTGCLTVFDVPFSYLSPLDRDELIKTLL